MLRTHEPVPDIPETTTIENRPDISVEWLSADPYDALERFPSEASLKTATGTSPQFDSLELGLDSDALGFDSSLTSPTQRKAQSCSHAHLWNPLAFESTARSRALVWLLVSVPVSVFLISLFLADAESIRRTAIEATGRVRSAFAWIAAQTSLARQWDRSTAAEPPSVADRLEGSSALPPNSYDYSSSSEPITERLGHSFPSIGRTARSPAPALSEVQESSPPTKRLLAATLTIDSHPAGASVFVDGQPIGTTPMQLGDVSPGTHVIKLRLAEHLEWESTMQVAPGKRNRVTGTLEENESAPEP
jgi:hypothetical protein